MNDPCLDPAIAETANQVEHRTQDGHKESKSQYAHWTSPDRELTQFLEPTRWWYASTEIPLIAATFEMEIVSDGEPPYAGQVVGDPAWEVAINAVSLAAALFANFCLLLTMARKMSFNMALPIVIAGWYVASIVLVIILIIVGRDTQSAENMSQGMQTTEAYYYGCIAAGLYFTIASLLIFTVYGAMKGHYSRNFHLSQSQRTLTIQNIGFLVYLLAGAAVYSHIEGRRFNDAVWWSDFTILTIGIGYPSPMTHLGRGLLFPYAFGGILIIGVVVGSIRSLVLERGKNKLSSHLVEKTRDTFIRQFRDFANFIGELTVLPGDMGYRERLKEFFSAELWPLALNKPNSKNEFA
ncbi:hypothetical protein ZTR_06138 [Talaromyces verruculosus]|nr:hypothetical protein ZTR_06138 [Talaromyces verruculosus]